MSRVKNDAGRVAYRVKTDLHRHHEKTMGFLDVFFRNMWLIFIKAGPDHRIILIVQK